MLSLARDKGKWPVKVIGIEEHFVTAHISFIEEAVLSPEQKDLVAHGNWERLIGSIPQT
jgi:hypothetical protein